MNNFNQVCPSGNTLVDGFKEERKPVYLETIEEVRGYIRNRVSDLSFGEMRDILREFDEVGYLKV